MANNAAVVSIPVVERDGIVELSGASMLEIYQGLHRDHLSGNDVRLLDRASHLVVNRFCHLRRASGEPLYEHSLAVFLILHRLDLSIEARVAAILHDIIEDTSLTSVDIARWFGGKVATMVFALTKCDNSDKGERCYIAKTALAVDLGWWEAAFIKLSDVVHNMATVGGFNDRARELSYAREKQNIILPALEGCCGRIPRDLAGAYRTLLCLAKARTAEVVAAKRSVNPPLIVL